MHKIGDLVCHEVFGIGAISRIFKKEGELVYHIEWMGNGVPWQYYYIEIHIDNMKDRLEKVLKNAA